MNNQKLGNKLEEILNQKKYNLLKTFFLKNSFLDFENHYLEYRKDYKDSKWKITTISNHPNKIYLNIQIKSKRDIGNQIYNLHSKQTVKIETFKNKIKSYKVINEESILNTEGSPLIVKIIAPNEVQTGERYEVNLIVEKPLDNSLIASGMVVLKNREDLKISKEKFGIKPNLSGGLFKYVQAPLIPGFQTISAIITHPKGIYSLTKTIKVGL
ncbi:hypothetical protein [Prochlorococcus marinus]|nr:hypothetical protein [Prochlorococcus marinus]